MMTIRKVLKVLESITYPGTIKAYLPMAVHQFIIYNS